MAFISFTALDILIYSLWRDSSTTLILKLKEMEGNTIELIKWIISSALGTGWLLTFLFYRSKKRKANAEADKEEMSVDFDQIAHLKEEIQGAYSINEKQQEIINKVRTTNIEQQKKINDLELKVVELERRLKLSDYNKCMVENCCDRIPNREDDLCKYKTNKHE